LNPKEKKLTISRYLKSKYRCGIPRKKRLKKAGDLALSCNPSYLGGQSSGMV
jgi:hypothetical protein